MAGQWQDPRQGEPHVQPHVQNSPPQGNYQQQWQPQYPPPPQSPYLPRKSRKGIYGIGCLGLIGLVILVSALASHTSSSAPPAALPTLPTVPVSQQAAPVTQAAAKQTLTYEVTGSPANVTYGPAGTNVSGTVPLSASGPLGNPVYYHITAQLQGDGSVTCKILIDGKVISQATASGGYNIAMCEINRNPLTGNWTDTNGGS